MPAWPSTPPCKRPRTDGTDHPLPTKYAHSLDRLQREWRERLAALRRATRRVRSDAAAWRVLELLPRGPVLTGPIVARELAIPLKSATAALRDVVDAGVLVEHGTMQPSGRGRPSRLYTSAELLGLTGSNPLRV